MEKVGSIEYVMPKSLADNLLKTKAEKSDPQKFLVKYVNEECGLLYNCVKVTIS